MSERTPKTRGSKPKTDDEPKPTKKVQKGKAAPSVDVQMLQNIAHQLRIHSVEMTIASNSGHPTSCASMAEIIAVLFFTKSGMRYNPKDPKNFGNDRFVLSKGHAAPILYAAWSLAGFIDPAELLQLRKFTSDLEGHPTPKLPFVDVATGSLGQGLSVAGGMAYSSKYLDKIDNHYWVLIGDGESAEGSIWEAAHLSSYYKLDNLTAIVDINRLGQSEATSLGHEVEVYKKRWESFGWSVNKVDGHNIQQLAEAMEKCRATKGQPQVILAKTFKGKYFEKIEDQLDWHGKPVPKEVLDHLRSLQTSQQFDLQPEVPEQKEWPERHHFSLTPNFKPDQKMSTRKAYGTALVSLSKTDANRQIVALDGDTKNSTFSITYKEAVPTNFVECFIAEQNMVGWAQGLACRGKVALASTFGTFFSRAFDQIRMGGISKTEIKYVGSHCGVSIGEDGPSQMGLEDIAMFRTIPDCVVLYPSDGVSAERAIELVVNRKGICYVRTSRPDLAILYSNDEQFEIGKAKVVKEGKDIVIVAGGVTTHEALKAAKELEGSGVHATVIDLFSVKPVDKERLVKEGHNARSKIILTVEDHYKEGGLFETVAGALSDNPEIRVFGNWVTHVPRSGTPTELVAHYHLDAKSIQARVQELLK